MPDIFDLTNKVAIITGGAGLLAAEHAKALCSYGAKVILADVNEVKCTEAAQELQKDKLHVDAKKCDVTSKESWQSLLDDVMNNYGKIDILINNAGFTNQSKSANYSAAFEDFPLEDWNAIMNVNLTGTFLGCQVVG